MRVGKSFDTMAKEQRGKKKIKGLWRHNGLICKDKKIFFQSSLESVCAARPGPLTMRSTRRGPVPAPGAPWASACGMLAILARRWPCPPEAPTSSGGGDAARVILETRAIFEAGGDALGEGEGGRAGVSRIVWAA